MLYVWCSLITAKRKNKLAFCNRKRSDFATCCEYPREGAYWNASIMPILNSGEYSMKWCYQIFDGTVLKTRATGNRTFVVNSTWSSSVGYVIIPYTLNKRRAKVSTVVRYPKVVLYDTHMAWKGDIYLCILHWCNKILIFLALGGLWQVSNKCCRSPICWKGIIVRTHTYIHKRTCYIGCSKIEGWTWNHKMVQLWNTRCHYTWDKGQAFIFLYTCCTLTVLADIAYHAILPSNDGLISSTLGGWYFPVNYYFH